MAFRTTRRQRRVWSAQWILQGLVTADHKQTVAFSSAQKNDYANVLILDEATSDLDSTLENQVHQAIEQLDGDYIMLVIAHRLSTVVNADQIHAVKDGQISESGTHQELLDESGVYPDMYETQNE